MQPFSYTFINQLHEAVEMFWWSFIKAPAAFVAAWGFFSMMVSPAHVAEQSMQIARYGGMPQDIMTGIVTTWFLCGCAVFGISVFARVILKARLYQPADRAVQADAGSSFHP